MSTELFPSQLKYWWLVLISGLLFILMGFFIFSQPVASYLGLALFFAATFLVSGIFEIIYAVQAKKHDSGWGWMLTGGIIDFVFGVFMLSRPELTMVVMPIYVGLIILFRAVFGAAHAFHLKKMHASGWGWILFAAILGIILALMMIVNPLFGGLTIIFYTGFALLMLGMLQVIVSLRLRTLHKKSE